MMSCEDIVKFVTEYDEGALSAAERRAFESHVVVCPPCRGFVSQIRGTRDRLGREADGVALPRELEESIVEAFRAWKREQ